MKFNIFFNCVIYNNKINKQCLNIDNLFDKIHVKYDKYMVTTLTNDPFFRIYSYLDTLVWNYTKNDIF